MRILAIPNYKLDKTNSVGKTKKISNGPCFGSNYENALESALKKGNIPFSEMQSMFTSLVEAAKTDPRAIKSKYAEILNGSSLYNILRDARDMKNLDVPLIGTSRPQREFIHLLDGRIKFTRPSEDFYGAAYVTMWIDHSGIYSASRLEHFNSYYVNKNRKEYYSTPGGAGISDHIFYKKDGSEDFWKNLFY